MTISIIVAMGNNRAIGKDNRLLWHLPADLKYFKNTTMGKPVLMGRKTFESVGKPLPGRKNIIISGKKDFRAPGCVTAGTIEEAIEKSKPAEEIFIAGGGEIYSQSMPLTNKLYVTKVSYSPEADTFFPEINPEIWKLIKCTGHKADEKNSYDMRFMVYERIRNSSV